MINLQDASTSATKRATVIVVASQKGGVAKTTCAIQLAAAQGEKGKRALYVDLDATARGTQRLKLPTEGLPNIYHVLTSKDRAEEVTNGTILRHGAEDIPVKPRFDVIPSSRELSELDDWLMLRKNSWVNAFDLLVQPIESLRSQYDFIFLDTPPQTSKAVLAAYKACDAGLVTMIPEPDSQEAVSDTLEDFELAREANPKLFTLGIVCSIVPHPLTRLADRILQEVKRDHLREDGTPLLFDTTISRGVSVVEAGRIGESIFEYEREHKIAVQYMKVTEEIEARLKKRDQDAAPLFRGAREGVANEG